MVFLKNDSGFDLNFAIQDSDGEIVNLATVSSIIFKMKLLNATSTKISSTCTVVTAASGTCSYTIQATDFDTLGNYETELQINYPANEIVTAKLDDIYITGDL
jgi:hypothetical protein